MRPSRLQPRAPLRARFEGGESSRALLVTKATSSRAVSCLCPRVRNNVELTYATNVCVCVYICVGLLHARELRTVVSRYFADGSGTTRPCRTLELEKRKSGSRRQYIIHTYSQRIGALLHMHDIHIHTRADQRCVLPSSRLARMYDDCRRLLRSDSRPLLSRDSQFRIRHRRRARVCLHSLCNHECRDSTTAAAAAATTTTAAAAAAAAAAASAVSGTAASGSKQSRGAGKRGPRAAPGQRRGRRRSRDFGEKPADRASVRRDRAAPARARRGHQRAGRPALRGLQVQVRVRDGRSEAASGRLFEVRIERLDVDSV
ncbi:unnamed protein product [Trichogramma brassicae]|uniref:Uncharacterized protein n=1 Tax=Trichogramma brassicae TaxID=86971 RepID=A0A6H5IVU3_9HYME|nr:unnamed protein product [Trichogramma brassicae]